MTRRLAAYAIGVMTVTMITVGVHAATEDVNLPADYKTRLVNFATVDRMDNGQVRVLYGPQGAVDAARAGQAAPSGSVMVMEIYTAQRDAQNALVRAADGRLQRGPLTNIYVMEKRAGWGTQYTADIRNGEWEYAIFTPAGQRAENRDMKACMTCHLPKAMNDFLQLPALSAR